ncbi:MAG: hypothetical protein QN229_04035 [Desulfurococcaceae archaeon TW002]
MRLCKLLLDTSALLLVGEGVDLEIKLREDLDCDRVELYTLDTIVSELRDLASSRSVKKAPPAKHALDFVTNRVIVVSTGTTNLSGDKALLTYASLNPEYIVVTLDRKFRKSLKLVGVKVATWWSSKRRFSIA